MTFKIWLEAQNRITCSVGADNPVIGGVPQMGFTIVRFNVGGSPYAFLVDSAAVKNGWLRNALKYKPGTAWNQLNNDRNVRRSPPRSYNT